jgi:hypothetical protein
MRHTFRGWQSPPRGSLDWSTVNCFLLLTAPRMCSAPTLMWAMPVTTKGWQATKQIWALQTCCCLEVPGGHVLCLACQLLLVDVLTNQSWHQEAGGRSSELQESRSPTKPGPVVGSL